LALWALPSGWWARSVGARGNIAYSTWALGSDIWSLGRIPVVRHLLAKVLKDASLRYADGLKLCADVEAIGGAPCEFLPSSRKLDVTRRDGVADAPPYKLAFLGRWHPNKGADLLMQSLGMLHDDDWARISELRYFGGGPLDAEIHTAAESLQGAARPVTIGGYLDKHAAAELISWADYLLLPSRIESIPVIFSDAMQLGTPIISTPVGDLPHLFEKYGAGVLAQDSSAKAYCAAIREGLSGAASRYCDRLHAAAADFDLQRTTQRLLHDIRSTGR
jgi:glycosyltransferase involved in cell wall biosynthesis